MAGAPDGTGRALVGHAAQAPVMRSTKSSSEVEVAGQRILKFIEAIVLEGCAVHDA